MALLLFAAFGAIAQTEQPAWVSIGPTNSAGSVTAIEVHPTLAGTVYVGARGGGLWKTTDAGASWTPLTDDIARLNVGAVALAPSNPSVVYVGSGSEMEPGGRGLVKSTDGGTSWNVPQPRLRPGSIGSRFTRRSPTKS